MDVGVGALGSIHIHRPCLPSVHCHYITSVPTSSIGQIAFTNVIEKLCITDEVITS